MTPTLSSFCCAWAANGNVAATKTAATSVRFIMGTPPLRESVSGRLSLHTQEAAALPAGGPGAVLEGKAGPLEESLVDGPGDAAERRHLVLGEPGLAPGVLQRAAVQLDLEARGVGAQHLGPEDLGAAGDVGEERLAQPGEIRRGVFRERRPRASSAAVDRLRHQRLRPGGAELL